ncbi:hypothetical protein AVJ22_13995 (plasmid) [Staphylococcus equorum]|nr:hypothetical protein AVJ22_13995 [Staphylococcus equorum]
MIKTRLYLKFKIQLEKLNNGNRLPIPFEEKRSIVKCTTIIDKHSFKKVCKSTIESDNEISTILLIVIASVHSYQL